MRAIGYEAEALGSVAPPVLLVDEVDRADDEFEAFLLEILSDYAITVPELGTFRASVPPIVVVTSNRTRDVHDALKRRCLYHWIAHPDFERELEIIRLRAPEIAEPLAREIAGAIEALRGLELYKPPGVAETIDWAQSLATLGATRVRRPDHIAAYDRAFDAFWSAGRAGGPGDALEETPTVAFDVEMPGADAGGTGAARPSVTVRWSPVETLRDRDFASYTESE